MPRLLAILLALVFVGSARAADRAQLDSISVHLFLTKSGTLSPDVTAMATFAAWNFVPEGEGIGAGERFDAILIKVRLTAPHEVFAKGPQAEVVMREQHSRKVVRRERIANVYVGKDGWTFVPVFVADAACGPFDIVATGGGRRIVKMLNVKCGE
jgi:hypothetical protein